MAGQFLTCCLGEQTFGLDILRVQEIKGYVPTTPIPNAPPHVKGVMNLRGTVVPILDLRRRFGLDAVAYTKFTVIVIVTIGAKIVGLIVDAVSDVIDVTDDAIAPAPDFDGTVDTSFITGLVQRSDQLVTLLDLDRLATGVTSSDPLALTA